MTHSPDAAPPTPIPSFWSGAGPVLFLTAIFLFNFLSRIVLAPMLPTVEADLGISHARAGSLFFFTTLGYMPSLVASGFVSARIQHRYLIIASSCLSGCLLLGAGLVESAWGLSLALFCLGLATGLYLPSGIATLTDEINEAHWGKALATHELAPNLSLVSAPLLAAVLLAWMSWQEILMTLGLAALCLGLGFARWGRGGRFTGEPPNLANLKLLTGDKRFWALIVLFSLGVGASLGIYTMLPLFLVNEHGLEMAQANTLIGLSRVAGVFMAFASGWVVDRLGVRQALAVVFGLTGLSTVGIGLASGWCLWVLLFLQPTFSVCFFPAGFAALSRLGSAASRGLTVSLTVPLGFVMGSGIMPSGIGWMGEHVSFAWGIVLAGVVVLGGLAVLPVFKKE